MKILFCDLCNESVHQSDLDGGRAFMRKGRVVCGKCDRLMSQREEASFVAPGLLPLLQDRALTEKARGDSRRRRV